MPRPLQLADHRCWACCRSLNASDGCQLSIQRVARNLHLKAGFRELENNLGFPLIPNREAKCASDTQKVESQIDKLTTITDRIRERLKEVVD